MKKLTLSAALLGAALPFAAAAENGPYTMTVNIKNDIIGTFGNTVETTVVNGAGHPDLAACKAAADNALIGDRQSYEPKTKSAAFCVAASGEVRKAEAEYKWIPGSVFSNGYYIFLRFNWK